MKKNSSIKRKRVKDPLKDGLDFSLLAESMILDNQLLWYLLNQPWNKVAIKNVRARQRNLDTHRRFINKAWRLTDTYF